MSIQSETALTPKLRFPEFSEEWFQTPLLGTTDLKIKYGIVDGPFGSNLKTIHYKVYRLIFL